MTPDEVQRAALAAFSALRRSPLLLEELDTLAAVDRDPGRRADLHRIAAAIRREVADARAALANVPLLAEAIEGPLRAALLALYEATPTLAPSPPR